MIDLMFFIKTLALALLIVMAMQIRIGEQSIETHTLDWVQTASVVEPLNGVARGTAKLVHDLSRKTYSAIHSKIKGKGKHPDDSPPKTDGEP